MKAAAQLGMYPPILRFPLPVAAVVRVVVRAVVRAVVRVVVVAEARCFHNEDAVNPEVEDGTR
jgi:hypothetical protein